jgi:hypothetical protein
MRLTTKQLVAAMRAVTNTGSMYSVYKALGTSEQTARRWCRGAVMTDEYALKAAELLGWSPDWVLASIAAERHAGTPAGEVWGRIADGLAPAAGAPCAHGQDDRPRVTPSH